MSELTLGHGIVRMENGQLRDNLSRLWCSCGEPAILYVKDNYPPYNFVCFVHLPKATEPNEPHSAVSAEAEEG